MKPDSVAVSQRARLTKRAQPLRWPPRLVLVFDDDELVCSVIAASFDYLGVTSRCATTMSEFKSLLAKLSPDLIVLDLALGETDAIRIFELLAAMSFGGRVVLTTGKFPSALNHATRVGKGLGISVAGVLPKPFTQAEFQSRILAACSVPLLDEPAPVTRVSGQHELSEILEKDWITFWGQPKVHLSSDTIRGVEILARAHHPTLGLLGPDLFLKNAGEGALAELSKRALESALAALSFTGRDANVLTVSINLAYSTLNNQQLLDDLRAIRSRYEFGGSVMLEITETEVGESSAAEAFATRAVLQGFEISIDDFGHGFATFDRLRTVPFSELKLERSVVHGCASDPALRTLCKAAVQLARGFNASAVAEGVETKEDRDMVAELGFDLAQGYFFGKPQPLSELETWLAR